MLNVFMYYMYTPPNFYSAKLQHSNFMYKHVFCIGVENSVDPDQMASLEAN